MGWFTWLAKRGESARSFVRKIRLCTSRRRRCPQTCRQTLSHYEHSLPLTHFFYTRPFCLTHNQSVLFLLIFLLHLFFFIHVYAYIDIYIYIPLISSSLALHSWCWCATQSLFMRAYNQWTIQQTTRYRECKLCTFFFYLFFFKPWLLNTNPELRCEVNTTNYRCNR